MDLDEQALNRVQDDIAERLETVKYLEDVTIFSLRPSRDGKGPQIADLQTNLDKVLAGMVMKNGKNGAAVSVLMPMFDVKSPNLPGPQGELTVEVLAQEHPLINNGVSGTRKTCESIAICVLQSLHQFRMEGATQNFYADQDAITPSLEFAPKLTYRLKLRAQLQLRDKPRCLMPTISEVAPFTVQLTNRTIGDSIYFTTDGSFPRSGKESATLYTEPFAVESGTVVRWASYREDLLGSDIGRAIIT